MPKSDCDLPVWLVTSQENVTDFYNVLDYLAFRCSIDKQKTLTGMCSWCGLTKTRVKLMLSILVNSYIVKKIDTANGRIYHYTLTDLGYKWLSSLSSLYLRVLNFKKKNIEKKISDLRLTSERNKINCLDLPKGINYFVEYLQDK